MGSRAFVRCRSRVAAWGLFLAVLAAGCATYHVGARSLFPTGIETVYVPVFESSSFRRDLGERITEAVVKEIERRTPYKVSGPGADSMLKGKLVAENKHVIVEARTGDPREMEVSLKAEIRWVDRRGNAIRDCPPVPVPADCVNVSGAANVVPEVGQSIATQQQKAIQRLAEQIVSLMETPW